MSELTHWLAGSRSNEIESERWMSQSGGSAFGWLPELRVVVVFVVAWLADLLAGRAAPIRLIFPIYLSIYLAGCERRALAAGETRTHTCSFKNTLPGRLLHNNSSNNSHSYNNESYEKENCLNIVLTAMIGKLQATDLRTTAK